MKVRVIRNERARQGAATNTWRVTRQQAGVSTPYELWTQALLSFASVLYSVVAAEAGSASPKGAG